MIKQIFMDCRVLGNTGGWFSGCEFSQVKITLFLSLILLIIFGIMILRAKQKQMETQSD